MSETVGSPGSGAQRYSLFHGSDAAEPGLKAWHAPYADAFRGYGEVVDLGCGPGYFLDLLRDRNVRAVGVDIDPAMVEAARSRGHDARQGDQATIAEFHELGGVHLSHVIEHLWGDEAIALLERSFAALRPGGLLIVRTPNWGNATVRHGGFWMDHTHKRPYPLELLTKVLGDIGFELVQSGHEPHGWEDTYVVARKRRALRTRVRWHGDFLSEASLARVNRFLARAVIELGTVDVLPFGEPSPQLEQVLGLEPRRIEERRIDELPTVTLRHRWPPAFMQPTAGAYAHMQPWEYGAAPRAWVELLCARADDVWCNSEHEVRAFAAAGVPADRLHVIPLGIDPLVFHPGVEPLATDSPDACVFLHVGAITKRKNLATLVEAYLQAFTNQDAVALLVKGHPVRFEYDKAEAEELRQLAGRSDIPPIRFIEERYDEDMMARLYRTATALVHPYRAEGFGMPVLEAMACGVPVVVPEGGATDDFVDDTVGYRIPARRARIGRRAAGMELGAEGWQLDPSIPHLVALLRRIYLQRDEARAKGTAAAERAHGAWTWGHAARKLEQRVDQLVAAPLPTRSSRGTDALNDYEQNGFSQNGEDGMLLELFSRLRVTDPYFAEFGVESGTQCNTALFATTYWWRGLMIEADPTNFAQLRENYKELPRVQTLQAFVTRENIGDLFRSSGVPVELDLLSIDVDGNDYHLWEALAGYRPRVVIVEINAAYPPPQRWVMAYNPTHRWQYDDYYGASLCSYADLGERLGYALLTTDSKGVNAIFVRKDLLPFVGFPAQTPEAVFHPPAYRFPHREGPTAVV